MTLLATSSVCSFRSVPCIQADRLRSFHIAWEWRLSLPHLTSPHHTSPAQRSRNPRRESRRESHSPSMGCLAENETRWGRARIILSPRTAPCNPLRAERCAREYVEHAVDDVDDAMRAHLRVPTSVHESARLVGRSRVQVCAILLSIRTFHTLHTNHPSFVRSFVFRA